TMKVNHKLEEIRKQIPQSVKDSVDELVELIDRAYQLGCEDTKQKFNISNVDETLSNSAATKDGTRVKR
ncbi:MAG: hypothetical protein O9311_08025, partial [Cytophagales bacterium]|nr:hypothetical protein [Cytophagales bacterium]